MDFWEGVERAACLGSALQMVAYRISALDVKLTHTRRSTCVGFMTRSSFAFLSLLPAFNAPEIGESPQEAGYIMDDGGEGQMGICRLLDGRIY